MYTQLKKQNQKFLQSQHGKSHLHLCTNTIILLPWSDDGINAWIGWYCDWPKEMIPVNRCGGESLCLMELCSCIQSISMYERNLDSYSDILIRTTFKTPSPPLSLMRAAYKSFIFTWQMKRTYIFMFKLLYTRVLSRLLYVCGVNKLPLRKNTVIIDAGPPITPVFFFKTG